jgi:PqqD family protein of HPr-rel-A system
MEYTTPIYKINSSSTLHFHNFGCGHSIVFDEASGQTHKVNELCLDALEALQQSSISSQAIAETLARCNDFSLDEEWHTYINEMLTDLDQLGLIEPVAS